MVNYYIRWAKSLQGIETKNIQPVGYHSRNAVRGLNNAEEWMISYSSLLASGLNPTTELEKLAAHLETFCRFV